MQKLILLCLQAEGGYDRGVMRGVITAARGIPEWKIRVFDAMQNYHELLGTMKPAGLIGRFAKPQQREIITNLRIPAISTTNGTFNPDFPRAGLDDKAIGRMAAEYFLGLGFEHFAFACFNHLHFNTVRSQAYRDALSQAGFEAQEIEGADQLFSITEGSNKRIFQWLRKAPKPLAVFCSPDGIGTALLSCCAEAGIAVPEEVAVLGVDNDDLLCELAACPMSSIAIPSRKVGELAVEMLQEILRTGKPPFPMERTLPPTGVVTRLSTDVVATSDPDVAKAMRFIRANRHQPIQVGDILRGVGVSRRKLEQKFSSCLGCTLLHQIHREHIALAKELLVSSTMSLDEIAEACGLKTREQLSRIFRKVSGDTPAAFRNSHRSE